jgi:hypothetical protein
MSSFLDLPQAQHASLAGAPLEQNEVKFSDEQLADAAALKLVTGDADMFEAFVQTKMLPQEWDRVDDLVRAWVTSTNWPGTNKAMANLGMPLIMEVVETLMPELHLAFFSDNQPFLLTPAGRTTPAAARAMAKIVCWALGESGFKEEMRLAIKSALTYGTGVVKYGWQIQSKQKKKYAKDPDPKNKGGNKVTVEEYDVAHPTCEYLELRNILVDPHLRRHTIHCGKALIQQSFITADDLDQLDEDGYKNIPTREELVSILTNGGESTTDSLQGNKMQTYRDNQAQEQNTEASKNPLARPLELLEYWTADRVITVLQRKIVIRNEENEFHEIPSRSCAFIDVLGAFFGFGVGKLLEGEQRFQTGVVNAWINALALYLNPMWHRKKGIGPHTQNIAAAPGKVINDDGELEPIQKESVSFEALQAISTSEERAHRRVGSNTGPEMPTQAMRTAEGVQQFTAGLQKRLQYFVDNWATMVFVPIIQKFIELIKDNISHEQLEALLTEEEGKAFEEDIMNVYNGQYIVDVLSSTKLAARRAMAAMIPNLVQLLAAPPVLPAMAQSGKKFNFAELLSQMVELTGWDTDSLIVDMTPEDIQRMQQQNPQIVKAQSDQSKMALQTQHDLQVGAQKGDVQAGVAVIKAISKHLEPQDVAPGAPVGQ